MSNTATERNKILTGPVRAYIGGECAALPPIDGPTNSEGQLEFLTMGTNEVQNLALGGATGGTFTLTYFDYQGIAYTTAPINFGATDAAIQLALGLLEPIGVDGIVVAAGTDFVLTFSGFNVASRPQSLLVLDSALLTGGSGEELTRTTLGIAIWADAGLIEDGVTTTYTPTFENKFVDRTNAPLDADLVSEEATIEYELTQKDLTTLNNAICAATYAVQNQTQAVPAMLSLGTGDAAPRFIAVALQGKSPIGEPSLVYAAIAKVTGATEDKRSKQANNVTVTISVFSNLAAEEGYRLVNRYDMTAPVLAP